MPSIGIVASSSREAPDSPTVVSATNVGSGRAFNNGRVDVVLTAPSLDGGLPITSYRAISNPSSIASTPSISLTQTVTGLASGTPYTFTGVATNGAGDSLLASYSLPVTVTTVPQTMGTPSASDVGTGRAWGDAAITVSYAAPNNGGSAITQYRATMSPGGSTYTGTGLSITVTGLPSGVFQTFTTAAQNANGYSSESVSTLSIQATSVPKTMAAPTATAGNTTASVSFTVPGDSSSTGGKAISLFTATSNPGAKTGTNTTSPISVTGLTNGTAYTFTITATNPNGTSLASPASNSVTPVVPGPNFPNFVAPNFPNFPDFVAPNFPNFVAPNFPNFVTPDFVAPNFPNFVAPNFPNFVSCYNPCPPPYFGCQDGGALCAF